MAKQFNIKLSGMANHVPVFTTTEEITVTPPQPNTPPDASFFEIRVGNDDYRAYVMAKDLHYIYIVDTEV